MENWIVVNIHKNGTKEKFENCRGITHPSAASKFYADSLKNKSRLTEGYLEKVQCGFRRGRAMFTIQLIIEERREFNLPTFLLFLDYEKVCYNLNCNILWKILQEDNISSQLIEAIRNLCRYMHQIYKWTESIPKSKGVR